MKKTLFALLMAIGLALPASAQISIPNSFTPNTRIVSADVNENFTELGDKSLNRGGGTATGDIIFATKIVPDADGGADIGTTLLRFGTAYVDNLEVTTDLTVGGNFNLTGDIVASTLTIEGTGADALDVAGGITAGSGAVAIIGTDGRIPAISSTYFASLSGANLTGIPETAISDGAVLARLAANEIITGQWHFAPSSGVGLTVTTPAGGSSVSLAGRSGDDLAIVNFLTSGGAAFTHQIVADATSARYYTGASSTLTLEHTATSVNNSVRYGSAATQPGFFAYSTLGVTGAVDGDDVNFANEVYDTASNLSSGVFTAPVDGIYEFCFGGSLLTTGSMVAGFKFNINGTTYPMAADHTGANVERHYGSCIFASMTASQTARVEVYEIGSDTVEYGFVPRDVFFSGRLVP